MPTIADDGILAEWYFKEAVQLNPKDARLLGFLANLKMITGTIYNDERKIREGYYLGKKSISRWPEFNNFTIGYALSNNPAHSSEFQEGLKWQWDTLDRCTGEKVDRNNPDYVKYMDLEASHIGNRKKSVCWNSQIAPHNFEGFSLNMGDMLIKAGNIETAKTIYNNAKLSKTYSKWPFRKILEQRIVNATTNQIAFNKDNSKHPIMLKITFSCMACHQQQ